MWRGVKSKSRGILVDVSAEMFLRCGGDVLPFLAFAEDVGVGAGTVERDNVYLGVLLVEQQPVWIDVAFPVALVVASEHVVVQVGGQWLVVF